MAWASSRTLPGHHTNGQVFRVTADQLAMDGAEARSLLEKAGVELSEDEVDDLVARTEGWPAGLHLAALAIGDRPYEPFSGHDQLAGDYLVEEVLDATTTEMVEFLERSATFDYMDADLLDSLLDRSDSANMLAAIRSSGNLFLVPLDNDRHRFRYHHLFREVLQARLWANEPTLARRLDSRASVWLEQTGDLDGAVRHAISAHEEERAANLILRATLPRFFDGRYAQVGEWLALLGEDAVNRYPAAAVATAWHSIACGEPEQVLRACAAAERFGWYGPLADGSPSLPAALATVRIFLGADGVHGVIRDAEIVREAGGPAWNPWWALATGAQGTAYSMLGDLDLARQRITQAMAAAGGAPFIEAAGAAHLALLALHDGDLLDADRLASRARHLADQHHLDAFVPAVGVYAIAALVAARARHHDNAREAATIARSVIARLDHVSPRTSVFVLLLLTQTALTLGDRAEARVLLTEAQRARRRDPSATFLNEQLDKAADQLRSAGDLSPAAFEPLTAAELRVLDYLPTHLSFRDIAGALLISRHTAKSHSVAIYRKLGVSSRTDAVNAAREGWGFCQISEAESARLTSPPRWHRYLGDPAAPASNDHPKWTMSPRAGASRLYPACTCGDDVGPGPAPPRRGGPVTTSTISRRAHHRSRRLADRPPGAPERLPSGVGSPGPNGRRARRGPGGVR